MDKNIIIAIVLGVLLLVSVVQAFELNTIKAKLGSGTATTTSGAASSSAGGASAPAASSSGGMVGGC